MPICAHALIVARGFRIVKVAFSRTIHGMYAVCHLCARELATKPGLPFCEDCWPALLALPPVERCQVISRAQHSIALFDSAGAMKRLSDDLREMVDLSRSEELP